MNKEVVKKQNNKTKVFIYGTLRKGEVLNTYLGEGKFIGEGELEGYELYAGFSYPMMIKGKGIVTGEIYEVDEKTIGKLDQIESQYDRIKVNVKVNDELIPCDAYVYKYEVDELEKIESGDWKKRRTKNVPNTNSKKTRQ